MKVVFVCTGNTCRSPMAEGIFNFLKGGAASCGIMAAEGEKASENAVKVMNRRGIDISAHRSRMISRETVENCDMVLTMTKRHKDTITFYFPEAAYKVRTLGECAGGGDVMDPYGGDEALYDKCAAQIWNYIEKLIEKIEENEI